MVWGEYRRQGPVDAVFSDRNFLVNTKTSRADQPRILVEAITP